MKGVDIFSSIWRIAMFMPTKVAKQFWIPVFQLLFFSKTLDSLVAKTCIKQVNTKCNLLEVKLTYCRFHDDRNKYRQAFKRGLVCKLGFCQQIHTSY